MILCFVITDADSDGSSTDDDSEDGNDSDFGEFFLNASDLSDDDED